MKKEITREQVYALEIRDTPWQIKITYYVHRDGEYLAETFVDECNYMYEIGSTIKQSFETVRENAGDGYIGVARINIQ